MAELKTKRNDAGVTEFLNGVEQPAKRKDCRELVKLMRELTGKQPKMWGTSIVGFGSYHYEYASGHEGDSFITGFSPRARNLTIYVMPGFGRYGPLMKRLGKFKTGKSCLYVKSLDDVDREMLREIVARSIEYMEDKYECS